MDLTVDSLKILSATKKFANFSMKIGFFFECESFALKHFWFAQFIMYRFSWEMNYDSLSLYVRKAGADISSLCSSFEFFE